MDIEQLAKKLNEVHELVYEMESNHLKTLELIGRLHAKLIEIGTGIAQVKQWLQPQVARAELTREEMLKETFGRG